MLLQNKIVVAFFVVFFSVSQIECQSSYFRKDYNFIPELNAFYKVHTVGQKWSDAFSTCLGEGADMFVPKSEKEVNRVLTISNLGQDLWIAGHDQYAIGDFLTPDGKSLSESYVKWKNGEPSNEFNNKSCVSMESDGKFKAFPCAKLLKFVCKKLNANLTQNSICETYDPGYTFVLSLDRCYKFHTTALTWSQAFKTCRDEQSNLAIINSVDEADVLKAMFAKYPPESIKGNADKGLIHVGFNDLLYQGIHLTTDGKTLSDAGYDAWDANQPDNYGNLEHCGSMFRNGKLNDYNCAGRATFICEKTLTPTSASPANKIQSHKLPDDN